jgi:nucleoside-diphosphate-sugar epimerase
MADEQGFTRVTLQQPQRRRERAPGEARRTLVTGGAGFVGSYVCRALVEAGREVCAFDIRPFQPEGRFVLGDLADRVVLEAGSIDDEARIYDVCGTFEPDEIVHMAMMIDPAALASARTTSFRVNVGGTVIVLEAMRIFGVERLVNISSIGVLPKKQYEPIDSKHPLVLATSGPGTDFYGAQKASSELMCFAYHQALGIDFRTIRPSAVYGLGMTPYPGPIKAMVEGSVRGEKLRLKFGGPHPRDYTHAADIAGLVVALLGAPADADRIFFGATGRPLVTASEVARIVLEVIPGADVEIGDELSEAEKEIVALRGRLSTENARAQLGWEPIYGAVRDGIVRYADDYRGFLEASG